ncbi:S-layer homology domain-containing protein, partial [Neglecta sp. X4]|nr:S-layer homology domain-containing protein [Neglectibacter sp. 59]NBJ74831.1 S-layer homology domain-containing protein [Neglectibacter sp. X4]NCE82656.1 S-layer homology domain-containing protein [Neglectibacter sp. X58]
MIAAMIPLSAAAEVFKPTIYVDNLEMDNSGTTYTVTKSINPNSVYLSSNLEKASGILWVVNGEDEFELTNDGSTTIDLTQYATSISGDVYTLKVEQRGSETDNDGVAKVEAEYTLVITNSVTPIDKETAITKVVHDDLYDPASYKIEGNTITMILPFGATMPENLKEGGTLATPETVFVPASKEADVTYTASADLEDTEVGKIGEVLVSVAGGTKKYDVKVEYKDLFASLNVEGEVEHKLTSTWDDTTITDPVVHTLLVTLPYGTAASSIVPTFKLGDTIKKIEFEHGGNSNDDEKRTLTSGMTLPMDTSAGTPILSSVTDKSCKKDLTVTLDNGDEVTVSVVIEDKTDNPEAVLKSIEMVGEDQQSSGGADETTLKSVKQDVTGTNITIEMPASFKGPTATLNLVASKDATVQIVNQGNITPVTANSSTGVAALNGVKVSGANNSKTFEILVTSKDGNSKTPYRVTWHNAAKEEALLKSITFQEVDANGKVVGSYALSAANFKKNSVDQWVAEISVPYRFRILGTLNALKVFAVPSTGAEASGSGSGSDSTNGKTVEDWFSEQTDLDDFIADGLTLNVTNDNAVDNDTNIYIIKFKFQKAKTGHGLRGMELVGTDMYSQITTDNTYKAEIGTIQTTNGKTVNAIKVNLPYSWNATNYPALYASQLKLDDGAKIMDATEEKKALDPKVYGNQASAVKGIALTDAMVDSLESGKLDTTKAIKLHVANEEAWVDSQATVGTINTNIITLVANQDATIYYVYGVKAAPETGSEILSVESTLDKNVTAKLNKDSNTIDITVPYSYNNADGTALANCKNFTLNFALSKLAKLDVQLDLTFNRSTGLVSDLGSTETTDPTHFVVRDDKFHFDSGVVASNGTVTPTIDWRGPVPNAVSWDSSTKTAGTVPVLVTAEDGKSTSKYTIRYKVAEKQMGADLLEVSVNGTKAAITAGSTIVNLTLPVGTKLNPQKLDITASKMASVTINGQAYKPTNSYDLSSDLEIVVTSEGGEVVNSFTLKTQVAKGFSDVKSGDWFYNYVSQAVASGVVLGYDDGTFKPYNNISRQEFAVMTMRMLGGAADPNATIPYTDGDQVADWAKGAVAYCAANKILNGYEDGTFKPNVTITREEAAKILAAALKLEVTGTTTFADNARIQTWAVPYV